MRCSFRSKAEVYHAFHYLFEEGRLKSQGKLDSNECLQIYVLFTKSKIVHEPPMPAIDKGSNALNLVLQTLPMFSKPI